MRHHDHLGPVIIIQTFLPSIDYTESAQILDNKRLHKQALEGWQILMNLLELDPAGNHRVPRGWSHHPAVKMWRGHELSLHAYIQEMVSEWLHRGYNSTIGVKATNTIQAYTGILSNSQPDWLADIRTAESIASSHRRALLVKDYNWYSQFGWEEDPDYAISDYEYVWPVN